MLDLYTEAGRSTLERARKVSQQVHDQHLERRNKLIEKALGDNWKREGRRETLLNVLYRAVETWAYRLTVSRPRCMISTFRSQKAHFASRFQTAVNNYAKRIDIDAELAAIVMDAMFYLGVAKCYWAPSGNPMQVANPEMPLEPGEGATEEQWERYLNVQQSMQETLQVDPGTPMIERISPDDYLYDTSASRRKYLQWEMHTYRPLLEEVRADRRFDPKVVSKLKATANRDGDYRERADLLSRLGWQQDQDELEPRVTLRDVWLNRTRTWAVMSDDVSLPPLYQSEPGELIVDPFETLIFSQLPDNISPISLAGNLDNLHDHINAMARKMNNQARRQKTVTAYAGSEVDATNVRDEKDGGMVRVAMPDLIQEKRFGGVDPLNGQYLSVLQAMFNKESNNLDLVSGGGSQSPTATQDQILNAASGALEAKKIERVAEFTGKLFQRMGEMMWHDPVLEVPGVRTLTELGITLDASWKPDYREGEYQDYEFSFEPFSQRYLAPSEKVSMLNRLLMEIYLPAAQILESQGKMIDLSQLPEMHANLLNMPELLTLVKDQVQIPEPKSGGMAGSGHTENPFSFGGQKTYQHLHATNTDRGNAEQQQWAEAASAQGM